MSSVRGEEAAAQGHASRREGRQRLSRLVPVRALPPPLSLREAPYSAELEAARPAAPERALVAAALRGKGGAGFADSRMK